MAASSNRVYLFGSFRLDTGERALYREGRPVALTPKLAATLIALVEKHGHIVDKAELMQSVWPGTAVEEGNLTQNVHNLRKLLGDRTESGVVIETVPRRGYRLMGDVLEEPVGTPSAAEARVEPESVPSGGPSAPLASRGSRWVWVVVAIVSALSLGMVVWYEPWRVRVADAAAESRGSNVVVPVTSLPGEKVRPSLSPDGTRVAFSWNRGEGHDLYVKNTATDAAVLLARGGSYSAWSPDGLFIAFIRRFIDEQGDRKAAVLIVPALGGPTRQLWVEPERLIGLGLDWSPDGESVVLAARSALGMPRRLLLVATASGERRWLSNPPADSNGDNLPIFSPAGDSIAFVRETELEANIYILRLAGGEPRRLSTEGHNVRRLAWGPDGHTLIYWSERQGLWRRSIATGEAEPIPGVGEGAGDPSVSRLTGRLAFTQVLHDQNLYRVDLRSDVKAPLKLPSASTRRDVQGDISPEGSRIAFVSTRSGTAEVWTSQLDGSAAARLTDLRTVCRHPRWSPDGRSIAFAASPPGIRRQHIYVVDASSGLVRRLTSGSSSDNWATWSRDGRWVYFSSDDNDAREIWKVPVGGGPVMQVTKGGAFKAWESSDGRFLYYSTNRPALWRMPVGGGPSELVLEFPPGTTWGGEWVSAKNGIYWMNLAARPTIAFLSFATGQVTTVFTPPGDYDTGGGLSVSSDERWLILGQRDFFTSDIMMVDKLR